MSTLMEEKFKEAIIKKQTDINTFVWKNKKVLDAEGKYTQSEKKLVDMSENELKNAYSQCKAMLFNNASLKDPGRYVILESIPEQKDKCGAELFLRYLEQEKGLSRFGLLNAINEFYKNNREALNGVKPIVEHLFTNVSEEYTKIPLSLLIDGCLDRLGTFNKKPITRTFIFKQGIWLTPAESKDLIELDSYGNPKDRLVVIRERLNIKDIEKLYINSKGLNYTQMRAMLNIKMNKKYSDLTTMQLETLRYRILFNLEENIKNQIPTWEKLMEEIEMVAKAKEITL